MTVDTTATVSKIRRRRFQRFRWGSKKIWRFIPLESLQDSLAAMGRVRWLGRYQNRTADLCRNGIGFRLGYCCALDLAVEQQIPPLRYAPVGMTKLARYPVQI